MAHILLVDDDTELTGLLNEVLTLEGYSVSEANDGESGLEAINKNIDLVLLDVMMPKLNGVETLKRLREQWETPVLMLTAKGEDFDRIFGLELGADDYIPKPFNHRELLARVKAITRRIEHITSLSNTQANKLNVNSITINLAAREAFIDESLLNLTGTEYEVLALLVKNAGDVLDNIIAGLLPLNSTVLITPLTLSPFLKKSERICSLFGKTISFPSSSNKIMAL